MTGLGFHRDMPAPTYNADPCDEPSLTSSIARILLSATPHHAWNAHPRLNPLFKESTTEAMDLGSVAHEILLGKGAGFEVSPYGDYRTLEAREWRDDVISRGKIPIKAADLLAADKMVWAVHGIITEIPSVECAMKEGEAETVAIWRDCLGPLCRARIDLFDLARGVIYDLKTTGTGLSDRAVNARIAGDDAALDMRGAFYIRGVEQLLETEDLERFAYRWIFVESKPPFEARVFEMDETTRANGDRKASAAILLWQQCLAENRWPGYPRQIERSECPDWAVEEMHL